MNFLGFTLPDGAWLPPELIHILPWLSGAETKCVIAVLYHNTQVGGAEPLSLNDIVRLTGLARSTAQVTADRLSTPTDEPGNLTVLERTKVGQAYLYSLKLRHDQRQATPDSGSASSNGGTVPKIGIVGARKSVRGARKSVRFSGKTLPKIGVGDVVKLRESDREDDSEDSLSDSLNLLRDLRAAGVFLKTAQALVHQFDEARIRQHMDYYRYALEVHLAQTPGYLVHSIKEGWQAPLGYKANAGHDPDCRCEVCSKEIYRKYGAYSTE